MITDPIADYLTRVRNAVAAKHRMVEVPASNLKMNITKILFEKGYILNYKFEDDKVQGTIKIALKYHPVTKLAAINSLERVSRPGLRQYVNAIEDASWVRLREVALSYTLNKSILENTFFNGVEVKITDTNVVKVKGKLGELEQSIDPAITVKVDDGKVVLERATEKKDHKAKHGLYRALIANMIVGVSKGYTTVQELVGVGYKAEAKGQLLDLSLGYSHHIILELPPEVKIETESARGKNPLIKLFSIDKQLIGQVAAKIRSLRKPEPYKGKGIKFQGEELRKKAGKAAGEK